MNKVLLPLVLPVLASILITSGFGISQQAFAQIPPGFVDFNDHCYGLTNIVTWADSESIAVSFGGHLVTINNIAENTFILTTLVGGDHMWIGYNDIAVEGTFVWVSGEVVVPLFENWSATNPDNGGGSEDVTAFKFPEGEWNDFFSSQTISTLGDKIQGIIELDATCASAFTDEVIGGTIIPINTTALLLAGVQSISMWMIPVVLAGAGIGVFVIMRIRK